MLPRNTTAQSTLYAALRDKTPHFNQHASRALTTAQQLSSTFAIASRISQLMLPQLLSRRYRLDHSVYLTHKYKTLSQLETTSAKTSRDFQRTGKHRVAS